jgi:hypothetical protein
MSLHMVISDCQFCIIRVTDNYILYELDNNGEPQAPRFCASSRHVQPLVDLLPKRPLTLEIRNG